MNKIPEIPYLKIVEQTQQTPDAIAVLHKETKLTYAQLHHLSNQVANYLRSQGVTRNTLVGIMTERGPMMLIGILGIVKAGGAYVPLDPSYPAERIRYILGHAEISTLVTEYQVTEKLLESLDQTLPLQTLMFLDEGEPLSQVNHLTQVNRNIWSRCSDQDLSAINDPDDLMTVLYTSGSTGRPKGVMLNHRGYMNRLEWMQKAFQLTPGDRVAQKTSFCFDISVWELFWTLMEGATICPVEREIVLNPWEFAQWMKDIGITIMHFVPSLFGEFISALEKESWTFPDLRWLIFSGEALPLSFIQNWIDKYGMDTGLANLYGPTEASIDVTAHIITERPEETIPIGKAIDNVYLRILDDQMQPVAPGELGALWIGGVQLAKGYLKDSDRTAKAFRPNPFPEIPGETLYLTGDLAKELPDGTIEYHGRMDNQVKIRGFRVELGEIESVLNTHPEVREAAVLAIDFGAGRKRLVAWLSGNKVDNPQIKQHLSQKLPHYMIPQRIQWLPSLPKNHNGKLDRKALQALIKGNRPQPQPQLQPQAQSQAQPQSQSQLRSQAQPQPQLQPTSKTENFNQYLPLGPAQNWLVTYFEPPYQWTGYTRFRYHQPLNLDTFNQAFKVMVTRHPALATVFVQNNGQWQQQVMNPPQPPTLVFYDGSQLTEAQREHYIRTKIKQISQTLQIDEFPLLANIVVKVNESCYDITTIIHHMIADMFSGPVLFKEFWFVYNQMLAGGNVSFENPSPLSYTDYIDLLLAEDKRGAKPSHVEYWKSQFPSEDYTFGIPLDYGLGLNLEDSAKSEHFTLTTSQTQTLLREAKQHYGCNVYTLLLAPLYQLMARWSKKSWVVVSHRSHGRDLGNNQMFWESIGNFAVNFPVGIEVEQNQAWQQTIKQIKDQFNGLPMNGVTFDWISDQLPSYMYPDANLTPVRANYLGNRSVPAFEGFEFIQEERDRRLSPPGQKRTTLLEFFFSIVDGTVHVGIEYSRNFHNAGTIRQLGQGYLGLIDDMIARINRQALNLDATRV
ncbi:amino acid adenylation domain-containing protein [Moorena producens JHB]|uniref:Amino acid adenylation domain-containing protein n=1 Tax=Moorena producens (strain JHB) TaxID=1454205 RepID=A0A1D9GAK5_MOOP1|nr:amino acid adenylation domain-containing protein [Moorena producens]AOY84657.1 amino acid adenylation domain-containing protein [Moorena producens JHB]